VNETPVNVFGSSNRWHVATLVLMMLATVVVCFTFGDYGVTWDERDQREYGDEVIGWHTSMYGNAEVLDNYNRVYGGFFDVVAQLFSYTGLFDVYAARHLIGALFGLLGIVFTYRLGARLFGPMAGWFGACFLLLTPVYYGHMFNNPKDIPFAALCTVSLYVLVCALEELPALSRRTLAKLGIVIGLTMGIRIGGGVLLAYAAVFGLMAWMQHRRSDAEPWPMWPLARTFGWTVLLAWAVMVLFWPWALVNPLVHPFEALTHFTSHQLGATTLFNGQEINATNAPWTYLPLWFGVRLPEFYAAGLLAGAVAWFRHRPGLRLTVILVGTAWLLPLVLATVLGAPMYDGVRHFLFTLPPLAVLAGGGLTLWLRGCGVRWLKWTMAAAVALLMGWTSADMVSLHPYQAVYFNRMLGDGLAGASERFETDYWGASYREATEWLVTHGLPGAEGPVRVANTSDSFLTEQVLEADEQRRQRFRSVELDDAPDVVLSTTRYGNHRTVDGTLLHTVERQGVGLCYVFDVRTGRNR